MIQTTSSSRALRRAWAAAWAPVLLLALNVILNSVLFLPGERLYRGSIEPGYVSMARFVAENPNPWGWKPEHYCGLPARFAYLPGLPYLAAAGIWLSGGDPSQVYRVITVTLASFGPVAFFFLALYLFRDRRWALAAGAVYTFFSPFYILIPYLSLDAGVAQLPSRLHLQIKYGEAPHIAGLTLLPLAVLALLAALRNGTRRRILAGAVLLAAVALTNWVAALALAWCCLMLLLSHAGPYTWAKSLRPLAVSAGLAYLFSCFWLTPDFVSTVASSWPVDAFDYRMQLSQQALLLGLICGALFMRFLFGRFSGKPYLCFLSLCLFSFGYVALAYHWFGIETIPESRRYTPEAELFAVLLYFALAKRALERRSRALCAAMTLLTLAGMALGARQVWRYATKPALELTPFAGENTPEYRVAGFLNSRKPAGRVFVTGGTRFHLNSRFAIPQTGGTFESGVRNRVPIDLNYQILSGAGNAPGQEGATAVLQLKALAVEYVAVHGPGSREFYRDFRNPAKFEGLLERVYVREGDVVYRVPFVSYAHLVRPEEMPGRVPTGRDAVLLESYVKAIEDPERPKLESRWAGASALEIRGRVPEGMRVSVQVTHHPGWKAFQDGAPVPVEKDALGFLLLKPRPAPQASIRLIFESGLGTKIAAAISVLAWLGGIAWWFRVPGGGDAAR